MDSNKISAILVSLQGKIPPEYAFAIRQKLESLDDDKEYVFLAADLKSPLVSLVLSLVLGVYGIDRFYIGDTTMGILKLVTCGGLGIWTVIDWFLIMDATKQGCHQAEECRKTDADILMMTKQERKTLWICNLMWFALLLWLAIGWTDSSYRETITVCPTKLVWHIPCPTCGVTRAFLLTAHGRFAEALQMTRAFCRSTADEHKRSAALSCIYHLPNSGHLRTGHRQEPPAEVA